MLIKNSKVYIAGKITGLSDFKEKFQEAEDYLKSKGNLVMNPSILPEGFPWDAYMPICYAMIDQCEAIYLLDNWKDSRGANLEKEYAEKKGITILYQD